MNETNITNCSYRYARPYQSEQREKNHTKVYRNIQERLGNYLNLS